MVPLYRTFLKEKENAMNDSRTDKPIGDPKEMSNMPDAFKFEKSIVVNEYSAIIFSVSYVNPVQRLEDIEKRLSDEKLKGKVLFDLFACNGNLENRYCEAEFNGTRFYSDSFRIVKRISDKIKTQTIKFYKEYPLPDNNTDAIRRDLFES